MKIEAKVKFTPSCMFDYNGFGVIAATVNVDADYVEDNEADVYEWVANELYDKYGINFDPEQDFTIENIDDVIEDLKFDEFKAKTQTW